MNFGSQILENRFTTKTKQNETNQNNNNNKTRGKKSAQCPPTKKRKNQQAKKQKHSQSFHLCVNGEMYAPNNLKKTFKQDPKPENTAK